MRTWFDDLGIDHKSNRSKFSCSLCAYGMARDLKGDNITRHEENKGHQAQGWGFWEEKKPAPDLKVAN